MKNNIKQKGFTLIELLVVIGIIGILVGAGSQINLNSLGDDNRLTIFNNKIISHYETIRNNALLGKGIDSVVGVPDTWKITYSTNSSGTITPAYSNGGGWITYTGGIITSEEFHEIRDIDCLDLSKTSVGTGTTAEIIINGNDFSLSGDCGGSSRILKFTTKFKNDTTDIHINTINGLIEVQ